MNKLTGYYTLRIRRIYVLLIVLFIWMQTATMLVAYYHLLSDEARWEKELETYSRQLLQELRTITLSHCFHSSDKCLEDAYNTIHLPNGEPIMMLLESR